VFVMEWIWICGSMFVLVYHDLKMEVVVICERSNNIDGYSVVLEIERKRLLLEIFIDECSRDFL